MKAVYVEKPRAGIEDHRPTWTDACRSFVSRKPTELSAGSYGGLSGLNYNPENGAPARFEL
jgi:hypothetical protein